MTFSPLNFSGPRLSFCSTLTVEPCNQGPWFSHPPHCETWRQDPPWCPWCLASWDSVDSLTNKYTEKSPELLTLLSSPFAFSKRKLGNGEIFRPPDFDDFRHFWAPWVEICVFKKMGVCVFFCERRRGNLQKTPGNSSRAVSDSYRLKPLHLASPKALFPQRNCR